MKIYISVDMEGIGGICLTEQIQPPASNGDRRAMERLDEGRKLLVGEVNAAVGALSDYGVDEVIVADRHNDAFNFPMLDLDTKARYVMGYGSRMERFPFLDRGCDGMILLGYHAMAGTQGAVLEHTWDFDVYHSCLLNGFPFGEIGMDGLICGTFDVPVILVTGDDKACAEASSIFENVETCEVKVALGRHSALMLHPATSRDHIRESVKRSVARIRDFKPYKINAPYEALITYKETTQAVAAQEKDDKTLRVDTRTIRYRDDDIRRLFCRVF